MVIITLLLTRSVYPLRLGSKAGKKYVDWVKDNPPDNSITKILSIGVGSTEDGDILVIGINQIMPGKEKEALELAAKQNVFLSTEVEGLKIKSEVIWDLAEAYKIIGMSGPDT
ncbi:MAG: hypothetical protein KGD58_14350 [Candidatus Lokiarchaeota archaeon]|nr:hypothetical protein [Candidatus Lokiarchaeota archaeon]